MREIKFRAWNKVQNRMFIIGFEFTVVAGLASILAKSDSKSI